jgi:hypothetical protein
MVAETATPQRAVDTCRSALVECPQRHTVDRVSTLPSTTIAQARGMASAQAQCTLGEAHVLMMGRVQSDDLPLILIAAAVVRGDIRFDQG